MKLHQGTINIRVVGRDKRYAGADSYKIGAVTSRMTATWAMIYRPGCIWCRLYGNHQMCEMRRYSVAACRGPYSIDVYYSMRVE